MGKLGRIFSKIRSFMLHGQEATNKFRLIIRRLLRIRKLNHLKLYSKQLIAAGGILILQSPNARKCDGSRRDRYG